MYKGKRTKELNRKEQEYENVFGSLPDEYEELELCNGFTYDEYLDAINRSLATGLELPDVVD